MAPALVQAKNLAFQAGSDTSIALAFDSAVAAGNLIFIGVSWDSSTEPVGTAITSVIDSLSNTYIVIGSPAMTSPGSQGTAWYYAEDIAGGSNTVTVNFVETFPFRAISIAEYSGLATSSSLLAQSVQANGAVVTGTDGLTTSSINPGEDGALIVGSLLMDSVANAAPGTGFTERTDPAAGGVEIEDFVQGSAASVPATWTAPSATGRFNAVVAAFAPLAMQAIRPDADIVTTGWATAPLFSKVNETSPDGTVISATAS